MPEPELHGHFSFDQFRLVLTGQSNIRFRDDSHVLGIVLQRIQLPDFLYLALEQRCDEEIITGLDVLDLDIYQHAVTQATIYMEAIVFLQDIDSLFNENYMKIIFNRVEAAQTEAALGASGTTRDLVTWRLGDVVSSWHRGIVDLDRKIAIDSYRNPSGDRTSTRPFSRKPGSA